MTSSALHEACWIRRLAARFRENLAPDVPLAGQTTKPLEGRAWNAQVATP